MTDSELLETMSERLMSVRHLTSKENLLTFLRRKYDIYGESNGYGASHYEKVFISSIQDAFKNREKECDAHNISEAFGLYKEALESGNSKEANAYKRMYQRLTKDSLKTKPLKWEKSWDY